MNLQSPQLLQAPQSSANNEAGNVANGIGSLGKVAGSIMMLVPGLQIPGAVALGVGTAAGGVGQALSAGAENRQNAINSPGLVQTQSPMQGAPGVGSGIAQIIAAIQKANQAGGPGVGPVPAANLGASAGIGIPSVPTAPSPLPPGAAAGAAPPGVMPAVGASH